MRSLHLVHRRSVYVLCASLVALSWAPPLYAQTPATRKPAPQTRPQTKTPPAPAKPTAKPAEPAKPVAPPPPLTHSV